MDGKGLTKSKIAIILSLLVMVASGFLGIILAFFVNKIIGVLAIFFGVFLGFAGIVAGVLLDKVWKK